MKARGAAIQTGLAAAGLLGALIAWQKPPEATETEATVLDVSSSDIDRIRFEGGDHWAELIRQRGDSDVPVVLHYGTVVTPPSGTADGGTPDAGTKAPPPKSIDRTVSGNELAEKAFDKWGPLKATRALGKVDASKLKELGLDTGTRKVEVTVKGKPHDFTLANQATGVGYVLDPSDGRVYLIPIANVSELDSAATRLIERRLHVFRPGEAPDVRLSSGGKQSDWIVSGNDTTGQIERVAAKAKPDSPDGSAKAFLEKIWRVVPFDFLGKGELPSSGTPQVIARIDYAKGGKPVGFLEIAKAGAEIFLRTEHTTGWVRARVGEDLIADAKRLAGG